MWELQMTNEIDIKVKFLTIDTCKHIAKTYDNPTISFSSTHSTKYISHCEYLQVNVSIRKVYCDNRMSMRIVWDSMTYVYSWETQRKWERVRKKRRQQLCQQINRFVWSLQKLSIQSRYGSISILTPVGCIIYPSFAKKFSSLCIEKSVFALPYSNLLLQPKLEYAH